jgi:hypothetical protein
VNNPLLLFAQSIGSLWQAVKRRLRQWTKPSNNILVLGTAIAITHSKSELVLENALLRQQLIVLKRQTKRPKLAWRDRCAGYLTHPCEFLPSEWSILPKPGIMLADPKTYLESTTA